MLVARETPVWPAAGFTLATAGGVVSCGWLTAMVTVAALLSDPCCQILQCEGLCQVVVGLELRPITLSATSPRALSIRIGTALRARRRPATSNPESPGSMRSRTTTSGPNSSKMSSAARPSAAPLTYMPRPPGPC